MTSTKYIDDDGGQRWVNSLGNYHREDGPAVIRWTGEQEWWVHGLRHRTDGPARIWSDGQEEWFHNGQRHRDEDDKPAYIGGTTKSWWILGKRHRLYAPALYYQDSERWFINDTDVTVDVDEWISENNYPEWRHWNDTIKMMFSLRFR